MGALEKLREAIDELAGTEPSALGDAESVLELARQFDRLEALTTHPPTPFSARTTPGPGVRAQKRRARGR